MNIQAKKVLILYFKNMTVGDYRVVLDYADMPLSNFVIEYLRKNEKFRETVFDCTHMWRASLLSKGRGRKSGRGRKGGSFLAEITVPAALLAATQYMKGGPSSYRRTKRRGSRRRNRGRSVRRRRR